MCLVLGLACNDCPNYFSEHHYHVIPAISTCAIKEAQVTTYLLHKCTRSQGRLSAANWMSSETTSEIYKKATESAEPLVTSTGRL